MRQSHLRLSHLTALAVLAALLAAMFVALQVARAADCVANPGITLGLGQSCDIDVAKIHKDATGAAVATTPAATATELAVAANTDTTDVTTDFTITAGTVVGSATINITAPDDTNTPADDDSDLDVVATLSVTTLGFGIAKAEIVDDPDGIVNAGPQFTVRVVVRSAVADTDVRLTVPATSGMSIETDAATGATSQGQIKSVTEVDGTTALAAAADGYATFIINTAGAPAGDYELTVVADQDGNFSTATNVPTDEGTKQASTTVAVTIGEAGLGVSSATLSLGNKTPDVAFTTDSEAVPESGSAPASGKINLVVRAFNSLGEKARTGDVNQITVIAPGGQITTTHETTANTPATAVSGRSSATLSETRDATSGDLTSDDVGQMTGISVGKADQKPGTVAVYAIVSGPGGAATTETLTLTFTGGAAALELSDATEALLSVNVDGPDEGTDVGEDEYDTIKLKIAAMDAGGNSVDPATSGYSVQITDPDGKNVNSNRIAYEQPKKEADGMFRIKLTGKGTAALPLARGEYTAKVSRGTLSDTATFVVAGSPASVEVTADPTSSDSIGDVISVSISVSDDDGNPVADGTEVKVEVSANTGLAAIGVGHPGSNGNGRAKTKAGSTSVKYAVVGAGTSVISASAGNATGVAVVISTAGVADSADSAERDPRLSDFANGGIAGLTSYTGPDTTASQLMALLAGRATAIWLSNGDAWVLYSSVDGSMVPGSVNFTVTSGNVIYISN